MTPRQSRQSEGKEPSNDEVIELLLGDGHEEEGEIDAMNLNGSKNPKIERPTTNTKEDSKEQSTYQKIRSGIPTKRKTGAMTTKKTTMTKTTISRGLQAGLVLEEDIFAASETTENGSRKAAPDVLFEDPEFGPVASSIQGVHRASVADASATCTSEDNLKNTEKWRPKCRCRCLSALRYNKDGRPYFSCGKNSSTKQENGNVKTLNGKKCKFFSWAFRSELIPWYRFGSHNEHVLVRKDGFGAIYDNFSSSNRSSSSPSLFSAQDLVQGKVGDCWFLSALAVVAERSDLVQRLFQRRPGRLQNEREDEQRGIVRVNLFLDGIWTAVVIDNFLPCFPGGGISKKEEEDLQKAIEASLLADATNNDDSNTVRNPYAKIQKALKNQDNTPFPSPASENDPYGLSETNLRVMKAAVDYIANDHRRLKLTSPCYRPSFVPEGRRAQTLDLAYSKARRNQLWVPFLEKAYAKIHGSYQAISGGHVAEAFLDLTGAPTLQIGWHAGRAAAASSSTIYDDPRLLWADLKRWRNQKLPMGCGTDRSDGGLIGMHAYSILDVRELTNVGVEFFQDRLLEGNLGNVSGFTEYDGKLRLLRVRNPHGQGEWKGEFSDKCQKWQTLLASSGISLPRTMANDGTFWIGYDDFLLGFSNIDVVLAFEGNHAKSFVSNFPPKKSNHRCQRAFEVSLLDPQPGLDTKDRVEVFVMGIQKSKRGARQGRADRKKSYKVSDLGILVGEYPLDEKDKDGEDNPFLAIHGQMFGFRRNGHYKLVLDRKECKRLVVMPISFGHPAATDEDRSFVVRFNADAPLMIRELESTPRMDCILGNFLMAPKPSRHFSNTRQGMQNVLWKDSNYKVVQINCLGNQGGTVFVYLCALTDNSSMTSPKSIVVEATCRGMSCRISNGLLDHETMAKGKKFQASWRKFSSTFTLEAVSSKPQSRLLMVLFQSGQDTEMGKITCTIGHILGNGQSDTTKMTASNTLKKYWKSHSEPSVHDDAIYKQLGVFNPITMDTLSFQRCGAHFKNHLCSKKVCFDIPDSFDIDLERAIRASREDQSANEIAETKIMSEKSIDLELERAIALSREDSMLQEALKRSQQDISKNSDTGNNGNDISASESHHGIVIQSCNEPVVTMNNNSIEGYPTIDLTGADFIPVNSETKITNIDEKNKSVMVFDLTAADDEPRTQNSPRKKAGRADSANENNICILVESSDEDEDKPVNSVRIEKLKEKNTEVSSDSDKSPGERTNPESREKKRKLAAEAALRRMKKCP